MHASSITKINYGKADTTKISDPQSFVFLLYPFFVLTIRELVFSHLLCSMFFDCFGESYPNLNDFIASLIDN